MLRLGRVLIELAALLAIALVISGQDEWVSLADPLFWATFAVLVWLRHLQLKRLAEQSPLARAATAVNCRRYVLFLTGSSIALWSMAQAVACLA